MVFQIDCLRPEIHAWAFSCSALMAYLNTWQNHLAMSRHDVTLGTNGGGDPGVTVTERCFNLASNSAIDGPRPRGEAAGELEADVEGEVEADVEADVEAEEDSSSDMVSMVRSFF